jgi:arylsulfatase A-like enzyme
MHADGSTARTRPRRSVLVIASDGLRPDRIRPEIAPRLSALTARGTSFESAYVDIPRTMSSWTTILTGLHPHHHGIRSGFPQWSEVSPPPDTLPARLKANGYRTGAVSDYVGEIFGRVDFGFGWVDVPPSNFPAFLRQHAIERSVPLLPFLQSQPGRSLIPEVALWSASADPRFVASSAVNMLREIHDDPFFMVVFFSTTHFPYAAPAPYHSTLRTSAASTTAPSRPSTTQWAPFSMR